MLPKHCEQVTFNKDPQDSRWLFVIHVVPCSKHILKVVEIENDVSWNALIVGCGQEGHAKIAPLMPRAGLFQRCDKCMMGCLQGMLSLGLHQL